ncbi:NAD(P)H-dependent oxidoreductase [Chitinophaga rhizophila]|uniref:NAD(P)H-dependent oxidoreductase n=1 Tax=Chitinophaga rhizophila TaxID=2866212 RepID=A0ABS7G5G1_9BACT|nr:NAD(P)H-dependent oxidoreductase [Chitinophaga rhizophila]MBW8682867.1 NAD(P)H-dependent oxidoreductase [Chitinophaga rhizophila]
MKRVLVMVIHPDLAQSKINKRWVEELSKDEQLFHVHDLYKAYPDGKIDVAREQALIEAYDHIIFQFPFYWFNCPPLFKTWLDDVLIHGWAFGSKSGYKLEGKKIALAVSAGIDEEEYQPGAKYKYTLEQLTAPFQLSFEYVKADYQPMFAFFGAEYHSTTPRIEESATAYINYIRSFAALQ